MCYSSDMECYDLHEAGGWDIINSDGTKQYKMWKKFVHKYAILNLYKHNLNRATLDVNGLEILGC